MHLPIEFPVYTYFLDKIPYYLLLHIVQDVFEVQIIVVVFNSFSYTALKQGRCLDQMKRGRNTRGEVVTVLSTDKYDASQKGW